MKAFLIGTILMFVIALFGSAYSVGRNFSMLELAEQSDVVFVGKVTDVADDTATVSVTEVLSGELDSNSLVVSPVHVQECIGSSIVFSIGEQALIFGKNSADRQVTVTASGEGTIKLGTKSREMEIEAAKRILEIVPLNEHEKNEAMLAEVRSQNARLRSESRHYIVARISHSDLRDNYKDNFVSLIWDTNPEIQRTGLQGIQFVRAQDAIPRMVELTRSEDLGVVSEASMALGRYDTQESVSALIALTKHENPQIRIRACIDLDDSIRPEAKEALKRLLDDNNPKVRAMAPRGLVYWLRRNEADDVLPKLEEMLNDGDAEVRSAAANQLGECQNSEPVIALLAALKKQPQDENMKRWILQSLYRHYGRGDAKAKELIDRDIQEIVLALKSGDPNYDFGPSFEAVGILGLSRKVEAKDALRWASESHPNMEIRAYAQRCLLK